MSEKERATVLQVLADRATARPQAFAYGLVDRNGDLPTSLTYGDLQHRVARVHAALARDVSPGDRVLMLFSSPLEFLVGFLGVLSLGAIAVPAPPPEASRLKRARPRLQAIVADCQPRCLLVDRAIHSIVDAKSADLDALGKLPCLVAEDLTGAEGVPPPLPSDPDRIAYLQYTSGSTATPRGVMVSHRNLLANLAYGQALWGYNSSSIAVNWMPYFHDYGLVEGLLQPLYSGVPSYQIPTMSFLRRPRLWLETIGRHRATHSAAPNFGYEHCLQRLDASDREGLELKSWRVASVGAEIVRPATIEKFTKAFAPVGFSAATFVPSYGLAEVTLLATVARTGKAPHVLVLDADVLGRGEASPVEDSGRAIRLVTSGAPGPGLACAIVDPDSGVRQPDGHVGEVWLRGDSVAQGYWQRPEDSEAVFAGRIRGDEGDATWLRTGDMGVVVGGDLCITGRRKDLIIVRGTNHYPSDIEESVRGAHPALGGSDCAAFALRADEQLVVVAEVDNRVVEDDLADILSAVRQVIAELHDLTLHAVTLVRRGAIPKTSSGKVQRMQCRDEWLNGRLAPVRAEYRAANDAANSVDRADAIIGWLRDYSPRRINFALMDERRMIPPNVILDFGNRKLLGLQAPQNLGGAGLSTTDTMRVLEQIGALDLSLGVFTVLHNALGLRPILRAAPKALRDQLVPVLAQGRELIAFALTEPGAGSNIRALSSTATPDGAGHWLLSGHKIWSGSSAWAGAINVFVRQVGADGEPLGISGFVVREGTAGLAMGNEALTMGLRGTIQNAVLLRGVRMARSEMLGEPGSGLAVAQDAMMFTRLCLAAICLGSMKRLGQYMMRYGERRTVSTGLLADNAEFLMRLSRTVAATRVVESLVRRTAERVDSDDADVELLYIACKIIAPELLWQASDDAMQMLGGRAYMENNVVSRIFRDCRSIRVFEGPTETLRHHLGARILAGYSGLQRLLQSLGDQEIVERIHRVREEMATRPSRSAQWSALMMGDVAAWSIAVACLEAASDPSVEVDGTVLRWCRERFGAAVEAARNGTVDHRATLGLASLRKSINDWEAAIGTEAVSLAGGVEVEMDESLRAGAAAAVSVPPAAGVFQTTQAVAATTATANESALTEWIRRWLARNLGIATGEIENSRPFASYGLESVSATNLALDLEAHLGRIVDPTLMWDYPTIAALTAHLAGDEKRATVEPVTKRRAAEISAEEELRQLIEEVDQLAND